MKQMIENIEVRAREELFINIHLIQAAGRHACMQIWNESILTECYQR